MSASQDSHPSGASQETASKASSGRPVFRTNTIADRVLRYPPTGISAVIVGGGIAGLWAALECWIKSHEVVVLEKSPKMSASGMFLER